MYISIALFTALLAAEGHAASSITRREDSSSVWNTTSCATSDLQIIKEWRNLTSSEKSAYIAAEKCLWELPANTTFDGVVNRHDDLTAVHQYLTPVIHAVVSPPHAVTVGSAPIQSLIQSPGSISAVAQALYEDTRASHAYRVQLYRPYDVRNPASLNQLHSRLLTDVSLQLVG